MITEASHLLGSSRRLLEAVEQGYIACPFDLQSNATRIRELCSKYADLPMDLADACLVCLYEKYRHGTAAIITVDRGDFSVYRAHRNRALLCEYPPD